MPEFTLDEVLNTTPQDTVAVRQPGPQTFTLEEIVEGSPTITPPVQQTEGPRTFSLDEVLPPQETIDPALVQEGRDVGRIQSGFSAFMQGISRPIETFPKFAAVLNRRFGAVPFPGGSGIPFPVDEEDPRRDPLFQAGEQLGRDIEEIFPRNPEFQDTFLEQVSEGAGDLIRTVGLSAIPGAGPVVALGDASVNLSTAEFQNALDSGADEETAFNTFLLNLPVGATEVIPVGRFFRRLDNVTGGGVKQVLAKGVAGGLEEATQEVIQNSITNATAQSLYDDSRNILDGAYDSGIVGGTLGFVLNAVGVSIKQRTNPLTNPNLTSTDIAESERVIDDAIDVAARRGDIETFNSLNDILLDLREQNIAINPLGDNRYQLTSPDGTQIEVGSESLNQFFNNETEFPTQLEKDIAPEQNTFVPAERPEPNTLSAKRRLKKWLAPQGSMPRGIFDLKFAKDSKIEAEMITAESRLRELRQDIKDNYPEAEAQAVRGRADAFLKTGDTEGLQESTLSILTEMRNDVDALSRQILQSDLLTANLGLTISDNIGTYMHRSYRVHDDPDWAQRVPQEVLNQAKSFIQNKVGGNDAEVQLMIDDLLYSSDTPVPALRTAMREGSIDPSPFRSRLNEGPLTTEIGTDQNGNPIRDLAPEIRALLGEYNDAFINYSKSMVKLSNIANSFQFTQDVADQYTGTYFFKPDDPDRPRGTVEMVAPPNAPYFRPLAGLRTTPEIASSFYDAFAGFNNSPWMSYYMRANAALKYSKTVANQVTHVRNILGGAQAALMNGHFTAASHVSTGFNTAKDLFRKRGGDQERVRRYAELGLLSSGVRGGEIHEVLRDAQLADDLYEDNWNHRTGLSRFYKALSRGARRMADLYNAEDAGIRVIMFESEFARYKEALYGDKELTQEENLELEEQVAGIVRDTYQNYNLVPASIRLLRRSPVVGSFVSFQYEMIRTAINTAQLASQELRDPQLRRIGAQRLAGLTVATFIPQAIAAGISGMTGVFDDEEEDMRRHVAPWAVNHPLGIMNKDADGFTYTNLGAYDILSTLKAPITALINNPDEDVFDRALSGFGEIFASFLGEEILLKAIREARSNKKENGSWVYNPVEPLGNKLADSFVHIAKEVVPGVLTSSSRVLRAGDEDRERELLGWLGLRATRVRYEDSARFKALRYIKDKKAARKIYNQVERDNASTFFETESAFTQSNVIYEDLFEIMSQDVQSLRRMGYPRSSILRTLRDAGVGKDESERLLTGRFRAFEK